MRRRLVKSYLKNENAFFDISLGFFYCYTGQVSPRLHSYE
jgi:hypothetical protein